MNTLQKTLHNIKATVITALVFYCLVLALPSCSSPPVGVDGETYSTPDEWVDQVITNHGNDEQKQDKAILKVKAKAACDDHKAKKGSFRRCVKRYLKGRLMPSLSKLDNSKRSLVKYDFTSPNIKFYVDRSATDHFTAAATAVFNGLHDDVKAVWAHRKVKLFKLAGEPTENTHGGYTGRLPFKNGKNEVVSITCDEADEQAMADADMYYRVNCNGRHGLVFLAQNDGGLITEMDLLLVNQPYPWQASHDFLSQVKTPNVDTSAITVSIGNTFWESGEQ